MLLRKQRAQQVKSLISPLDRSLAVYFRPGSWGYALYQHAEPFIISGGSKRIDYSKLEGKQAAISPKAVPNAV